jgi:hypothetical protein
MLSGTMRTRHAILAAIGLSVVLDAGFAQEGHPLAGTWAGDWQAGRDRRTRITLVMNWDGKAVGGVVNPGPDAIPITQVVPDWSTWRLRIEAETTGKSTPVHVRAEGQLHDIGSNHRRIVGTWTQEGVSGPVTLTRE